MIYDSTSFSTLWQINSSSQANVMNVLSNGNLVVGFRNNSICLYDQNSYFLTNIVQWDSTTYSVNVIQKQTAPAVNLSQIAIINNLDLIIVPTTYDSFKILGKPATSYANTRNLIGHYDAVLDLDILNNGFLASSSKDTTIKVDSYC